MACTICGRSKQWHGSETAPAGTNLNETGCHDGVRMDDDEHGEGWQSDVIYPPCQHNPKCCGRCKGTGVAPPDVTTQDDCPDCRGTGWRDGKPEWPTAFSGLDEETPHAD